MNKTLFVLISIVAMLMGGQSQAQTWEVGGGLETKFYTNSEVFVEDPIKLYNFASTINKGKQLPMMQLKAKSLFAPAIWVKYRLRDGDSPLALGMEIILQGAHLSVFGEYEFIVIDSDFTVVLRPRAVLGWNAKFPARPDWNAFLAKELPSLTADEIEQGKMLFEAVSPSSLGLPLFLTISPRMDIDYPILGDKVVLRGSVAYNWDLMTIISSRSQSNVSLSIGAAIAF